MIKICLIQVFRVPETATILLGGGVKFAELGAEQTFSFQANLLKVNFFTISRFKVKNVL